MNKRHLLSLVSVLALGIAPLSLLAPAQAQAQDAAQAAAPAKTAPTPYPDPHNEAAWPGKGPIRCFAWMTDNRNFFWTQRDQTQGSVTFCGDSLTGNWGYDIATLKNKYFAAFPTLKFVNRGIGGEVSRGLLFRFQEDVLDLHPKAVVMLIGDNDLSAKANLDDVIFNITAMLDMAQKQDASLPVVVATIPPRNSPQAPVDVDQIKQLNERIMKLSEGRPNVHILDLFPLYALDGTTAPDPKYFRSDLLHFGPEGYVKYGQAVGKMLTELNLQ